MIEFSFFKGIIVKEIYCDGACSGNPGPGGWGVWLNNSGKEIKVYGHKPQTTNNQMELKATIVAVQFTSSVTSSNIYTNSNYVINGITKWIKGWGGNNWQNAKKEPVKNIDLWKELDLLSQNKKINWLWVKGHSGVHGNKMADALANLGSQGKSNEHSLSDLIEKNNLVIVMQSEFKLANKKFELNTILIDSKKEKFIVLENTALIYPDILSYKISSVNNSKINLYISFTQAHENYHFYESEDNYFNILNILRKKLDEQKQAYYALKNECIHLIVKFHDSAVCKICNIDFGWYCPDSPDNTCYYYTDNGKIELRNGEKVDLPVNHSIGNESDDWCIYCGNPNERK